MSWSRTVTRALLVGLFFAAASQAAEYQVIPIGVDVSPNAISDEGMVVGSDYATVTRAVILAPPLPFPTQFLQGPGGSGGTAYGVSGGEVVGIAEFLRNVGHAFTWNAQQGMRDLGTLGGPELESVARALNHTLTTVGFSATATTGGGRPVVWIGMQIADLGTLGGPGGSADAINSYGDIVGASQTASGDYHATLWTVEGEVIDLTPTLMASAAVGIADDRTVVGQALFSTGQQGFVWTPASGLQVLPGLPGHVFSLANGINAAGIIVGFSGPPGPCCQPVAVRWVHGIAEDLNTLIEVPGRTWTLTSATAINQQGQIVGVGVDVTGELRRGRAFLLTPIPPPLTVAQAPVAFVQQVTADFNGDGFIDQAGLAADSTIWIGIAGEPWRQLSGRLVALVGGDLDGDGQDDLAGLSSDSRIWCMTDTVHWQQLPGRLTGLIAGDFDGAGFAQLAGVASDSTLWISPRLGAWQQVAGRLKTLVAGKLTGNGHDTLAGLAWDSRVYAMPDGHTWEELPGRLVLLGTSLEKLVGMSADGRWWQQGPRLGDWRLVP